MKLMEKRNLKKIVAAMSCVLILAGCTAKAEMKNEQDSNSSPSTISEEKMDKDMKMMEKDKDSMMNKDKKMMDEDKDSTMGKDKKMIDEDKDSMMDKDKKMMDKNKKMMKDTKSLNFALKDVDGNEFKLSDYKGKKVYIKLWASWCPICTSSLPQLDELAQKNNGYEVITVVAPGYNNEKEENDFKTWYKGLEYKNIKVLLDNNGDSLVKSLGVKGYPSSAFIASDGSLAKFQTGHLDEKQINDIMSTIK